MNGSQPGEHRFDAVAYVDNVPLRELAGRVPEARPGVAGLTLPLGEGTAYLFPFGAVAFLDVPRYERDGFLARLPFAGAQTAVREIILGLLQVM